MDDIIDQLGNAVYVTKVDLLKGYYQIGLTDSAKLISAFVTPDGFFPVCGHAIRYEKCPRDLPAPDSPFDSGPEGGESIHRRHHSVQ